MTSSPAGDPSTLPEREIFWRNRYDWLASKGYRLRPRYKPGWIASWQNTNKTSLDCEDGVELATFKVIDAVRVDQGDIVMIKRVERVNTPYESQIGTYLSTAELSSDPRNHCCPVLEVLQDPYDEGLELIVMPLLRRFDEPRLDTVGEAVEFFLQTFEGLQFMHEHHIAHRDISRLNVMMDSRPILPKQFHPQSPRMSLDFRHFVSPRSRTRYPVKYYFTDFGHSRRYGPENKNPLEVPLLGGDKTVPEFRNDKSTPRNPFHTDVYYMGNLVRRYFLQEYTNLDFMDELIARMVHDDPNERPTMDEVVTSFKTIMSKLTSWMLRERLILRKDSQTINFWKDVHHVSCRTVPFLLTLRPPIPTPKRKSVRR
ncbi:hypothetical protein C8Q80DRAFT_1184545 [Daedaleopsis nitida]|nr:hypothetical protein C8Q80DRAFT_1184545 [Daedaleopsis nitida]